MLNINSEKKNAFNHSVIKDRRKLPLVPALKRKAPMLFLEGRAHHQETIVASEINRRNDERKRYLS